MKKSLTIFALLLIIAGVVLLVFFLNRPSDSQTGSENSSKSNPKTQAVIKGRIIDSKGQGVSGVLARCQYYKTKDDSRWKYEDRSVTDSNGQYEISLTPLNFPYQISAGGTRSTWNESKKFPLKPGEIYQVEDLVVRPTDRSPGTRKGRLVYEDGRPAANLEYSYASESLQPVDPQSKPKTNNNGEFVVEHVMPDELYSFWVFPEKDTICSWTRLSPATKNLEFTLKNSEYIELPEDWFSGGTDRAIADQMAFARDSRIQFSLPDLNGNLISLNDQRFKNKAVLVNLYGSWCGGCRAEIPYLVDFKNKYQKDGLEIVGIAFENGTDEEKLQAVKEIAQKFNVNYPLLIGGPTTKSEVGDVIKGLEFFQGYPTTLYIGRDGEVKHIKAGFYTCKQWELKHMVDHIKSILSTPAN